MRLSKVMWICVLVGVVAFGSLPAFARMPVRQSSDNGQGDPLDEANWNRLGRTAPITLTANGKKAQVSIQVICPGQDLSYDGSCSSIGGGGGTGTYLFLFQIQSTSANVSVNIGQLQKGSFTQVGGDGSGTYGVMICDDAQNDQELCTEDPNGPGYADLSGITFTVKSKTLVQFTIPSFPSFAAGSNPAEGQGLTLFLVTKQSANLPIAFPKVGIQ
jgi:hypothetical protein